MVGTITRRAITAMATTLRAIMLPAIVLRAITCPPTVTLPRIARRDTTIALRAICLSAIVIAERDSRSRLAAGKDRLD